MRYARIIPVILSLAAGCHSTSESLPVEVSGNRLDSTIFPPISLFLDRDFEYVGKDQFILYGVADAQIYLWARRRESRVAGLYWIQFEGYLPNNDHTYKYTNSETISVGSTSFYYDPFALSLDRETVRGGSDTSHVLDLLESRNLRIGPDVVGVRLVRLDDERRNELMIIYLEDLREHEFELSDVQQGGRLFARWPQISRQIRKRALAGLEFIERP